MQQKQIITPAEYVFQFLDARGDLTYEEIIHRTGRLEDMDAVIRVPGRRLGT